MDFRSIIFIFTPTKEAKRASRKFFKSDHPFGYALFFWAMGPAMWGLGSESNNSNIWFYVAYGWFLLAMAWSLGCWLNSDFLNKKNPSRWLRQRKKSATSSDWKTDRSWQSFPVFFIFIVFCASVLITYQFEIQVGLSKLDGRLYPSNEPLPVKGCGKIEDDTLAIFIGKFEALTREFPHTVLKVKGNNALVLNRSEDGSIALSLDIRDADNKIITQFTDGEFTVNQNNILKMRRKDRSSLQVIDQYGVEVLNVRYFNSQAIWIDAILRYPKVNPIVLTGSNLQNPGMCFGYNDVDMNIS